jgi:hypothetical protein
MMKVTVREFVRNKYPNAVCKKQKLSNGYDVFVIFSEKVNGIYLGEGNTKILAWKDAGYKSSL